MKTSEPTDWKDDHERRSLSTGLGFALFLFACLALVGWIRWSGPIPHDNIIARADHIRVLRFVDQPDGSIQVIDAATGRTFTIFRVSKVSCAVRCVHWSATAACKDSAPISLLS